jgi:hypothetical protein
MADRKLGLIKPTFVPRLKLKDYIEAGGTVPTEVNRDDSGNPQTHEMFANGPDPTVSNPLIAQYGVGDCVIARTLRAITHMHISGHTAVPQFNGDDALSLYSAVTGYDPSQTQENGNNPTDQGTDPNAMDTYWKNTGVPLPSGGVDKLAGYLAVDITNESEWKIAIYEFNGIGVGLNLTQSAETSPVWEVVPNDPVVGGHEIFCDGYSDEYKKLRVKSWGEVLAATYGYILAQCDQLTVYLSQDQLSQTGISDTGLNYDKLQADFSLYF